MKKFFKFLCLLSVLGLAGTLEVYAGDSKNRSTGSGKFCSGENEKNFREKSIRRAKVFFNSGCPIDTDLELKLRHLFIEISGLESCEELVDREDFINKISAHLEHESHCFRILLHAINSGKLFLIPIEFLEKLMNSISDELYIIDLLQKLRDMKDLFVEESDCQKSKLLEGIIKIGICKQLRSEDLRSKKLQEKQVWFEEIIRKMSLERLQRQVEICASYSDEALGEIIDGIMDERILCYLLMGIMKQGEAKVVNKPCLIRIINKIEDEWLLASILNKIAVLQNYITVWFYGLGANERLRDLKDPYLIEFFSKWSDTKSTELVEQDIEYSLVDAIRHVSDICSKNVEGNNTEHSPVSPVSNDKKKYNHFNNSTGPESEAMKIKEDDLSVSFNKLSCFKPVEASYDNNQEAEKDNLFSPETIEGAPIYSTSFCGSSSFEDLDASLGSQSSRASRISFESIDPFLGQKAYMMDGKSKTSTPISPDTLEVKTQSKSPLSPYSSSDSGEKSVSTFLSASKFPYQKRSSYFGCGSLTSQECGPRANFIHSIVDESPTAETK